MPVPVPTRVVTAARASYPDRGPAAEEPLPMTVFAALVGIAMLGYLVVALVRPEKF